MRGPRSRGVDSTAAPGHRDALPQRRTRGSVKSCLLLAPCAHSDRCPHAIPSRPSICSASPSAAMSAKSEKESWRDPSPDDFRSAAEPMMRVPARYRWNSCRCPIFGPNLPAWSIPTTLPALSGFADQRYTAFGGLSADIRYRLLDRASAPFGFAIGAEPHWGRADDITGAAGQPIWRRLCRRRRLGDHSRPRRRGVQPALSTRHDALEIDRNLVAGIHRGRCDWRDGAGSFGDLRRRRSPLFAPV